MLSAVCETASTVMTKAVAGSFDDTLRPLGGSPTTVTGMVQGELGRLLAAAPVSGLRPWMPVFPQAFAILIYHEKGFVDDPKNLGGATNLGVSLGFLKLTKLLYGLNRDGVVDARDFRLIKLGDAQQAYWARFWDLVRGDDLPPCPRALLAFDSAVNNGPGQSICWLQRQLG